MPEHIKEMKQLIQWGWRAIDEYTKERDILGVKVIINNMSDVDYLIRHPFDTRSDEWEAAREMVYSLSDSPKDDYPFCLEILAKRS